MVGSIWLSGITVALISSTQVKSLVVCAPCRGWRGQAGSRRLQVRVPRGPGQPGGPRAALSPAAARPGAVAASPRARGCGSGEMFW